MSQSVQKNRIFWKNPVFADHRFKADKVLSGLFQVSDLNRTQCCNSFRTEQRKAARFRTDRMQQIQEVIKMSAEAEFSKFRQLMQNSINFR